MKEIPGRDAKAPHASSASSRIESAGRLFLFLAGGLLLSVLVSCACGPVR